MNSEIIQGSFRVINSRAHNIVKHVSRLRDDAAFRRSSRQALFQGNNAISHIAKTNKPDIVLSSSSEQLGSFVAKELFLVSPSVLQKISATESPETLAAVFPWPTHSSVEQSRRLLVLDRVADPGNCGTLCRTAVALGWDGVFIAGGCDIYNDKALRAARGVTLANIGVAFQSGSWEELLQTLAVRKKALGHGAALVADSKGGSPLEAFSRQIERNDGPVTLVLSSEAHGTRPAAELPGFQRVCIPLSALNDARSLAESLNVATAGGILMHFIASHHPHATM
eukprot:TRINITY_DN7758_c0_g1_i1.p1 TRINITY_DN7758_c0_g1~~TRINITY_DN7758_c0_g1_i1.p1  ORF type:complete len:282 (+),score=24.42 TRINITY_DN7758_c0_g1_i1:900-1745(+)